jgi:hypothetical protein
VPAVAGAVLGLLCLAPAALLALPAANNADETAEPFWMGLVYLGEAPALLAAILAALILLMAVTVSPPRPLRQWRRRPAVFTAVIAAGAILAGLGIHGLGAGHVAIGSCTPKVPSGVEDPPAAHMSYLSRVYISRQATDDQRNLAQAAIGRGYGGGFTFSGGPAASGFTDAFCGHGRVAAEVAGTLPGYWTVDLSSPGLFGGLAAEVIVMPGVVAVQHVPTD